MLRNDVLGKSPEIPKRNEEHLSLSLVALEWSTGFHESRSRAKRTSGKYFGGRCEARIDLFQGTSEGSLVQR